MVNFPITVGFMCQSVQAPAAPDGPLDIPRQLNLIGSNDDDNFKPEPKPPKDLSEAGKLLSWFGRHCWAHGY